MLSISSAIVFFAVFFGLAALYSVVSDFWFANTNKLNQRIDDEFREKQRDQIQKSSLFKDIGKLAQQAASEQQDAPTLRERFERWLEQSGLGWTPTKFFTVSGGVAVAFAIAGYLFRGEVPLAGIVGLSASLLPALYVRWKRSSRLGKIQFQLIDAFDTMARVLRTGQVLLKAVQAVALECPQPLAAEFSFCYEQQNLGISPDVAFQEMADRLGMIEIQIFSIAAKHHVKSGGNFAELLDRMAEMARQRYRTTQKIASLTGEARFQANVLLALPPVVFLIMLFVHRDYATALFDYPGMVITTIVLQILGVICIRYIVNIEA